ncbi:cupin domain-containing protein [Ancylomarina euxinus]|uniref:Cupin domain-containing protein n=1 Tax=Ancylomarina euxinus TaxID=2283627 RepID=A0A425XYP5_9BACT|nr:cupin domain-containing protein [Ancylomarina euxinus]MCZ4695754.1 cupin domain-containing protein [Ancylomarina euxinus]MUP16207.1 cupin domain-containing protein [Ancylomarina euxinus]RRG20067.1 cupin domain-containing protein [Ancylomarina euxinus]
MTKKLFPEIIEKHPNADIPIAGLVSKLIQAGNQQFVFMEFDEDIEVADHFHNAQWGVVLEGEMVLSIDGIPRTLSKGDTYYIEKDVVHSAKIKKGYKDLTLFDQVDRYKIK